jgi:3',5'-cyclic AMP phosphodiesterase CpdA
LICAAFLLAILTFTLLQTSSQHYISLANAETSPPSTSTLSSAALSGNFSVIWITDTQYLSQTYPTYFDALCRWIVNHAAAYNVKMVIHTGDLVDTEGNQTQWENANHSISILLDAGIPYTWNAGNHDYNETCWIGNQYTAFNPSVLAENAYWIGDKFGGKNTAIQVNVSGWDLLVVNLANLANGTALDWANSILDAHPESHAIVATHAYLNDLGKYTYCKSDQNDSWAANFNATVLETHPNVFITLSAHFNANNGRRAQVGGRTELMFDRQDQDGSMGGATLRILTLDTANGAVDVKTFIIYANTFMQDSNDQFTFNTAFRNDSAQPVPEFSFVLVLVLTAALSVTVLVLRTRFRRNKSIR